MTKVLVDLGKLKDLHSGLGQVSMNFGRELASSTRLQSISLTFLLPRSFKKKFGMGVGYSFLSFLKRWFPSLHPSYALWHAIHQDSGYMPPRQSRYLLTIHDLNFMYEKSGKKAQKRLAKLKSKVERASHIVFISQFAQQEALKFLNLNGKTYSIIYDGVKVPDIQRMTEPSWVPSRPFLFSIGVVLPKKNFLVLIEMMNQPELSEYALLIAGKDNHHYAKEIMDSIAKFGLEDRVVLTGEISETDKNYFYHHCTGFLFPSLYEGFGMPVIEAMHCGKPVFCSECTSLPEIGGDKAFYWKSFEPQYMAQTVHEGLTTYFKNKSSFELDLKEYASKFSWKENARSYLELYEKLIHGEQEVY